MSGGGSFRGRIALTSVVLAALVATAALAEGGLELWVRTVLATDGGSFFDERLSKQRRQLEGLFRYSSYRLIKEERRHCRFGNPNSFEIPGGRYLQIIPKEFTGSRVHMKVTLIEGTSAPPLDTDFSLPNDGNIWVAGPKHPEGVLLISIGAEAK